MSNVYRTLRLDLSTTADTHRSQIVVRGTPLSGINVVTAWQYRPESSYPGLKTNGIEAGRCLVRSSGPPITRTLTGHRSQILPCRGWGCIRTFWRWHSTHVSRRQVGASAENANIVGMLSDNFDEYNPEAELAASSSKSTGLQWGVSERLSTLLGAPSGAPPTMPTGARRKRHGVVHRTFGEPGTPNECI